LNLAGWGFDPYGVLYENLNYITAKRQHILAAGNAGYFSTEFRAHRLIQHIDLRFRHTQEQVVLKYIVEKAVALLLQYTPGEKHELLQLEIDPQLVEVLDKVLNHFYEIFGFYPQYILGRVNTITHKNRIKIQLLPDSTPLTFHPAGNLIILGIGAKAENISVLTDYISTCIN
jgi:hypothetical protein